MLSELLLSLPLFEGVAADTLERLDVRPTSRIIDKGRTLFDRHDTCDDVHFVVSGQLICVAWTETGREFVFSAVKPGGYLGELAALGDRPRSLAVYAQHSSQIVSLSRIHFRRLIEAVPSINARVIHNLVELVRHLTLRLQQMNSQSVNERVRGYLANALLESGCTVRGTWLSLPTHAEIANAIGSNREAVTRAFSMLNYMGIVKTGRQRVQILRPLDLHMAIT